VFFKLVFDNESKLIDRNSLVLPKTLVSIGEKKIALSSYWFKWRV
tara:strand:+ start:26502 stop:26636 length:135 start_codon:yes stop_codon:yes gene_type:complete